MRWLLRRHGRARRAAGPTTDASSTAAILTPHHQRACARDRVAGALPAIPEARTTVRDVSTSHEPLLDRPDDGGGELSPTECAALLPRLGVIAGQWRNEVGVSRIDAAEQLTVVLRLCVTTDVELLFL